MEGLPVPDYTFSWTPTPTALFRFSALTWNAHLIHLDRDYARKVEGYTGEFLSHIHCLKSIHSYTMNDTERLVHGPLTALLLIEALRSAGYGGRIDNFVYRARNPMVVGQRQHFNVAFSESTQTPEHLKLRNSAILWAEDASGFVGMTATVDLLDL